MRRSPSEWNQPRVSGRFSVRHAARPPRRLKALVKPWRGKLPHRRRPQGARVVVHDDDLFLVLLQGVGGLQNLLTAHLARAADVSRRILLGWTQVDDQRTLVHQPDHILRATRTPLSRECTRIS